MAAVPLYLMFLTIFLHFVAAQPTNDSISVGSSLTATPDANPWLSPSGEFAFGFQQLQGNNDQFLLSIWYYEIPDKTIIWYPKDGPTVPRGSKLDLINGRGLVLIDPRGKEVWSSSGPVSNLAYGILTDTGNFVLVGTDSSKIWESFNFTADTLLPTQTMVRGDVINSKMGKFQLRLLQDGNLVLNTVDKFSGSPGDAYYTSGTNDESAITNSGEKVVYDVMGYMYILRGNGERFDLTPRGTIPSGDYYNRATLGPDGVFTQYYHPKNFPTGDDASWEVLWDVPKNICGAENSGTCGLNNVCSLEGGRRECGCPKGFALLDSDDPNGDCKPYFSPSCDGGYEEEEYNFIEVVDIDWPQSDYVHMNPSNPRDCKRSCLKDCFCGVAIYRDNQCWKKKLPLSNGRKDTTLNVKAFLKSRKVTNQKVVGSNLH